MIGKLQGIVDHTGSDYIILMTEGGVGYKVFTTERITNHESRITLYIETVVREDSIRLFGFTTTAQQDLFNQLTTVSGVGPKVAMAILSTLKPDVLLGAIATGDAKTISSAPGVGKKVAEKIIVELKNKCGMWSVECGVSDNSTLQDLLSAMESLGYKRVEIVEMAQKLVDANPGMDVAKLVPLALKQITKN